MLQVGIISRDKVRTCLFTGAWLQAPSPPPPDHTRVFHCLLSSTGWEQLPFSLLHSGFHLKHGAGAPKELEIEKMSSEGPLGTRYPLYLLLSGANFSLGSRFFLLLNKNNSPLQNWSVYRGTSGRQCQEGKGKVTPIGGVPLGAQGICPRDSVLREGNKYTSTHGHITF